MVTETLAGAGALPAGRRGTRAARRTEGVDGGFASRVLGGVCVLALAALAASGCSRPPVAREYELTGQVLAVDDRRQEVTIRHEDIPRFMPGMTMAFKVRDRELLAGRVPGDLVTATLVIAGEDVHLRRLERTGFAPLSEADALPPAILAEGEMVADTALVDQRGAPRRIEQWQGQVLAVTFIYTRCPLPNFCPLMDRHFAAVQEQIRADPALRDAARLLSVSVDPGHDTPDVLAAHAAAVRADPGIWEFATGSPQDVTRFAAQFGVATIRDDREDAEIVHNLRTAVIDARGRLTTVLNGGDWTPSELVDALRHARDGR